MGCPKNSTRAQRINFLKVVNHRSCRVVEDWALKEARKNETALEAVEEDKITRFNLVGSQGWFGWPTSCMGVQVVQ
jgi:hypothetical protein